MNYEELNDTISRKALPRSAPRWAKKNALATVSTVVTTLAAAVAIFSWIGFKPAPALGWDEAYVTHEQFNLLLVSIVKSVEKIENELGSLKDDIQEAKDLSAMIHELERREEESVAEEEFVAPPAAAHLEDEEVLPIPITPNMKLNTSVPLKGAYGKIQELQMEQRVLRK